MKYYKKLLVAALICLLPYVYAQVDQYEKSQTAQVWKLVDKGRDCGRSCFYYGIFERNGILSTANIGRIGYRQYKVDSSYSFRYNYITMLGSAGTAYQPMKSGLGMFMLGLLSGALSVMFGVVGVFEYYRKED